MHRSLIGIAWKSWKFKPIGFGCFLNRDWLVRKAPNGGADLFIGSIKWSKEPATVLNYPVGIKLGKLSLTTRNGKPSPKIVYVPKLPKEILADLPTFWPSKPK